jgi:hypothetical protein
MGFALLWRGVKPKKAPSEEGANDQSPPEQKLNMVPRVGVEPTLPKEPDFESSASANSAIWAHSVWSVMQVFFLNASPRSLNPRFD